MGSANDEAGFRWTMGGFPGAIVDGMNDISGVAYNFTMVDILARGLHNAKVRSPPSLITYRPAIPTHPTCPFLFIFTNTRLQHALMPGLWNLHTEAGVPPWRDHLCRKLCGIRPPRDQKFNDIPEHVNEIGIQARLSLESQLMACTNYGPSWRAGNLVYT